MTGKVRFRNKPNGSQHRGVFILQCSIFLGGRKRTWMLFPCFYRLVCAPLQDSRFLFVEDRTWVIHDEYTTGAQVAFHREVYSLEWNYHRVSKHFLFVCVKKNCRAQGRFLLAQIFSSKSQKLNMSNGSLFLHSLRTCSKRRKSGVTPKVNVIVMDHSPWGFSGSMNNS